MTMLFPRFYAPPEDGVDLIFVPLRKRDGQRRWERALLRCALSGRSPYDPESPSAALFERMDFGEDEFEIG